MIRSSSVVLAAHHEAGHTVAQYALGHGHRVQGVSLARHGVALATLGGLFGGLFGGGQLSRGDLLRAVIAGPLTEADHSGRALAGVLNRHPHDGQLIEEQLHDDSLDRWARRTRRLLGGYHRETTELAEALLAYRYLDADTVRQILDGAR